MTPHVHLSQINLFDVSTSYFQYSKDDVAHCHEKQISTESENSLSRDMLLVSMQKIKIAQIT